MAEQPIEITPTATTIERSNDNTTLTLVVYILYLVSCFGAMPLIGYFATVPMVIGVVIAYVCKGDAPEWLAEHYRFQIRTFWIYFFYAVMVFLLAFTVILLPFALLFGALLSIWIIVRAVRGLVTLQQRREPQNPDIWLY